MEPFEDIGSVPVEKIETVEETPKKCKSERTSYPCCSPENTEVYYVDEDGDWGYDFENEIWCGLTLED